MIDVGLDSLSDSIELLTDCRLALKTLLARSQHKNMRRSRRFIRDIPLQCDPRWFPSSHVPLTLCEHLISHLESFMHCVLLRSLNAFNPSCVLHMFGRSVFFCASRSLNRLLPPSSPATPVHLKHAFLTFLPGDSSAIQLSLCSDPLRPTPHVPSSNCPRLQLSFLAGPPVSIFSPLVPLCPTRQTSPRNVTAIRPLVWSQSSLISRPVLSHRHCRWVHRLLKSSI